MPVLTEHEINHSLESLPAWRVEASALRRNFKFGDFREAMSFVNSVAAVAERAGHHPDIDIRYNKVELALASHDAGGLTEKDFAVARDVDSIL